MQTQLPANRLRELREVRGLRLMDIAGPCLVYPSTVARWEDGAIPRRHVARVAQLLGVSVPYLDGWTDENGDPTPSEAAA